MTLLELDQPPNVTRAEHLALSVIYMLCDDGDIISTTGLELLLKTSEEGHDMLDLAVILGLSTLTREIARHLLVRFQRKPITEDSELFVKDRNGRTGGSHVWTQPSLDTLQLDLTRRTLFWLHVGQKPWTLLDNWEMRRSSKF